MDIQSIHELMVKGEHLTVFRKIVEYCQTSNMRMSQFWLEYREYLRKYYFSITAANHGAMAFEDFSKMVLIYHSNI
jgi:hypothetical protein